MAKNSANKYEREHVMVTNRLRARALESRWFALCNSVLDHGAVTQIDPRRCPLSLGQLHPLQHCAEAGIAAERG
jgi:hypothetical protein